MTRPSTTSTAIRFLFGGGSLGGSVEDHDTQGLGLGGGRGGKVEGDLSAGTHTQWLNQLPEVSMITDGEKTEMAKYELVLPLQGRTDTSWHSSAVQIQS